MFFVVALLYITALIALFYSLRWIKLQARDYVTLSKLPGPPGSGFLLGNLTYIRTTPENIFKRLREATRKYYPIYKLYTLHKVAAHILSPEDSELILSNPVHNQKAKIYGLLHDWLKEGLLTSTGPKWQTRRKILTPAFHFNILRQFVQVFNDEGDKLVEALKKESSRSYINIKSHIKQFTLKTIAETAMGSKLEFQTQKGIAYKEAIYDIGQIFVYRFLHPWFIFKFINYFSPWYFQEQKIVKILHKYSRDVIIDRERNFKDVEHVTEEDDSYKGKKRLAMLDLLLQAKKEGIIDEQGVQEEVDTFMFAGHDTTTAALSFALMLLACRKDSQNLLVQEMVEVLGYPLRKPTYEDLQNLKYMERCIKESLRLYPSVHFIARTLGEDVKTHSGYLLPKDTIVAISIYDIHHNPDIYPDPEKFDPDRFLPENSQNRHPFAYMPFSAGSRNCIGQKFAMLEMKAALCAILGNFVLEPIDTPDTIVLAMDIVLRTTEEIKIRVIPRV